MDARFAPVPRPVRQPVWALSRIPNEPNPVYERIIEVPVGPTDLDRAHDVVRQPGLRGDIDWPQASPTPSTFDFNLAYPKQAFQISVDRARSRATVRQIDRSFWSALRISHTFSGSRYNAPRTGRDWIVTSAWVFAMDALAAGLLVMVFGSYYMWYRLKPKRTLGWIALSVGIISCGLFVFGLSMFM